MLLAIVAISGFSAKAATVQMYLDVDHADRIDASTVVSKMGGLVTYPQYFDLVDGINTIMPTELQPLTITAKNDQFTVTSVTVEGVEVQKDGNSYSIFVTGDMAGQTIVVTTADAEAGTDPGTDPEPLTMCHVTFNFAEGAEACIEDVRDNYSNDWVAGWREGFDVPEGTEVRFILNTSLQVGTLTANGTPVTFSPFGDSAWCVITSDTEIYVALKEDVVYNVTVNLDNAAQAKVGYITTRFDYASWERVEVFNDYNLVSGVNTLNIPETETTSIVVWPNEGFILTGVTVDGTAVDLVDGKATINLAKNMVINITTTAEDTTGIESVNYDATDCDIYNILGRKVSAGYKGIVISRDGKKIVK